MKQLAFTLAASASMLLAGAAFASDYVILEVGDKKIKKSEVESIWSGLFPQGAAPQFEKIEEPIRQNILRGVVSEYLLYDEAKEKGILDDAEVKAKVDEATRKIAVRSYIEHKTEKMISEKDIKAAYDDLVKENKNKEEVRARHILVDEESKAKAIKKKLDDGKDFEKLAAEESRDKGSRAQGGDLGFFAEGVMVKEFSDVAFKLKKGEISDPVKSSFGWHVIKLEDRRKVKTPEYAKIKDELRANLVEKRLNDYVNRLVDQTNVKYFSANGKEKDFTKTPDQSQE
ncbi:MAG: peptidylprolyl isomerase [Rickettsiales bacterium]|nr:peptidylprolyl isomerase [Rickettsiales bacterium]